MGDPWFYVASLICLVLGLVAGLVRGKLQVYRGPTSLDKDNMLRRICHCPTCGNTWIEYPKDTEIADIES